MNNYLKFKINNYNNFDEIIEINNKINELKNIISKNNNLTFEINNDLNANLNTNLNIDTDFKKQNIEKITFYIKINKNIFNNLNEELDDDKCSICYELLSFKNIKNITCEHNICYNCFDKWDKICFDNLKLTNCPICRKIII